MMALGKSIFLQFIGLAVFLKAVWWAEEKGLTGNGTVGTYLITGYVIFFLISLTRAWLKFDRKRRTPTGNLVSSAGSAREDDVYQFNSEVFGITVDFKTGQAQIVSRRARWKDARPESANKQEQVGPVDITVPIDWLSFSSDGKKEAVVFDETATVFGTKTTTVTGTVGGTYVSSSTYEPTSTTVVTGTGSGMKSTGEYDTGFNADDSEPVIVNDTVSRINGELVYGGWTRWQNRGSVYVAFDRLPPNIPMQLSPIWRILSKRIAQRRNEREAGLLEAHRAEAMRKFSTAEATAK